MLPLHQLQRPSLLVHPIHPVLSRLAPPLTDPQRREPPAPVALLIDLSLDSDDNVAGDDDETDIAALHLRRHRSRRSRRCRGGCAELVCHVQDQVPVLSLFISAGDEGGGGEGHTRSVHFSSPMKKRLSVVVTRRVWFMCDCRYGDGDGVASSMAAVRLCSCGRKRWRKSAGVDGWGETGCNGLPADLILILAERRWA